MSALRRTAEALCRLDRYPTLSTERLLAVQRASAALGGRRVGGPAASHRALHRRIATIATAGDLPAIVASALAEERRSVDRALVHAYLRAMPCAHPHFAVLRDAAATAAHRHRWRWRDLGERHALWSPACDAAGVWRLPEGVVEAVLPR